jgi:hypothetical protein
MGHSPEPAIAHEEYKRFQEHKQCLKQTIHEFEPPFGANEAELDDANQTLATANITFLSWAAQCDSNLNQDIGEAASMIHIPKDQ